jgi:DNA adenine methylase
MTVTKPILKWVGGKTQILEEVLELFPETIHNYHEPFLGGGSVLLGVLSRVKAGSLTITGKLYASDLNLNLISFYKNVQAHPNKLIAETKKLVDEFTKLKGTEVNRAAKTLEEALTSQESYYFWIRAKFNALSKEARTTPAASAMFLFLNKTCFRGIYREGPHGFNVPFGNYKNPTILDEQHILDVSKLLWRVSFATQPFTESLSATIEKGDFVYLDPPYAPESETSFVSYTADGFDLDAHKTLFKACHELQKKEVAFVMSNADVKLVKDAFPSPIYTTQILSCRRAINSKNPEAKTNEVLIHNQ